MQAREIKNALKNKQVVFGMMVREVRSPAIARIMNEAGFDYIFIDMEHSSFSFETVADICLQARGCDLCTVVRIPCLEGGWVPRLLDAGADGIMCPMVDSGQKAGKLVELGKYPSLGKRGMSTGIGHTDFKSPNVLEVIETKNKETLLIAQIESVEGITNIDEIVSTEGIDVALVGPCDLSVSMGIPFDLNQPELQKNIDRVIQASAKAGIPSGIHTGTLNVLKDYIRKGMTFITYSTDIDFLLEGGRIAVRQIKEKP
jgi:2-keto-3-deoxy-L-rhamnonate aldolase RhmA